MKGKEYSDGYSYGFRDGRYSLKQEILKLLEKVDYPKSSSLAKKPLEEK